MSRRANNRADGYTRRRVGRVFDGLADHNLAEYPDLRDAYSRTLTEVTAEHGLRLLQNEPDREKETPGWFRGWRGNVAVLAGAVLAIGGIVAPVALSGTPPPGMEAPMFPSLDSTVSPNQLPLPPSPSIQLGPSPLPGPTS